MDGLKRFTGRVARKTELNGRIQSASVTITAAPNPVETKVVVAETVVQKLREWFGQHYDHGLHCVSDAGAQVAMANVAGEMPLVGRTKFLVEVVEAELDSTAGWQRSGYLLSMASMDAMADFLREFEEQGSGQ
jgi:hypothetical protein